MGDFGAQENPDLNIATLITKDGKVLDLDNTNVMQWKRTDGLIDQKYADRFTHSNCHFLIKESEL